MLPMYRLWLHHLYGLKAIKLNHSHSLLSLIYHMTIKPYECLKFLKSAENKFQGHPIVCTIAPDITIKSEECLKFPKSSEKFQGEPVSDDHV